MFPRILRHLASYYIGYSILRYTMHLVTQLIPSLFYFLVHLITQLRSPVIIQLPDILTLSYPTSRYTNYLVPLYTWLHSSLIPWLLSYPVNLVIQILIFEVIHLLVYLGYPPLRYPWLSSFWSPR